MPEPRSEATSVPALTVVPCAGALVSDERGRLLLVLRARPPAAGTWSLPGGRVEPGETTFEAVVREVAEETALVVTPIRVVGAVDRPGPGGVTYRIEDVRCRWVGGRLQAGDDAADARFVTRAQLRALPLSPGLLDTLVEWDELP